ncbi:MAG: choice-of-anchor Q domain-containing protein [Actinomycetota bacterium]
MSKRRRRRNEKLRRHRRLAPSKRQLATAGSLTLGAGLLTGASAEAATFTVQNLNDTGSNSIGAALDGNNLNNNQPTVDTVVFASGLSGTIFLNNFALGVYEPVDIQGPGAGQISIYEGVGGYSPIFNIDQTTAGDPVTISGLTLYGADDSAIRNLDASLTVRNAVITGNSAGNGGGINSVNGSVTVDASTLTGNQALGSRGGAIYSENGPVTVQNSTLSGNSAADAGGGVWAEHTTPITVQSSALSGNHAGYVGGGAGLYDGRLTVQSSTVTGNYLTSNNFQGGGGLYTDNGAVTVQGSTLSGNTAADQGGAIFADNPFSPSTIQNSTLQGNQASQGGAISIDNLNGQAFSIVGSTIAGNNSSGGEGGGLYPGSTSSSSHPSFLNTIVSGNTAANGPDVFGTVDAAFSLIQNPAGATINQTVAGSNLLGVDPLLGALANNGGPTQTMALPQSSPAIDKGSSSGLGDDQRGSPRPSDFQAIANSAAAGADGADIGAFELTAPAFLKCSGKNATIIPRPGLARRLTGTNKRDVIVGTSKKDTINSKGGNDLVCAKGGNDTVKGGGGKDKLLGQGGKDTLKGGGSRDTLKGGGGKDKLFGQGGKDKLVGGAKNDTCVGGAGNDTEKSC